MSRVSAEHPASQSRPRRRGPTLADAPVNAVPATVQDPTTSRVRADGTHHGAARTSVDQSSSEANRAAALREGTAHLLRDHREGRRRPAVVAHVARGDAASRLTTSSPVKIAINAGSRRHAELTPRPTDTIRSQWCCSPPGQSVRYSRRPDDANRPPGSTLRAAARRRTGPTPPTVHHRAAAAPLRTDVPRATDDHKTSAGRASCAESAVAYLRSPRDPTPKTHVCDRSGGSGCRRPSQYAGSASSPEARGCSSMAEPQPSKLAMPVRSRSPAPPWRPL